MLGEHLVTNMREDEKLHTLVTRPATEKIISDDDGRAVLSPLAFPERNYSGFSPDDPSSGNPVLAVPVFGVHTDIRKVKLSLSCHGNVPIRCGNTICFELVSFTLVSIGPTDGKVTADICIRGNFDFREDFPVDTAYVNEYGVPDTGTADDICPIPGINSAFHIIPSGSDSLSNLGILGVEFRIADDTPVYDESTGTTTITCVSFGEVQGFKAKYIGEKKAYVSFAIAAGRNPSDPGLGYVMLDSQDVESENGVYRVEHVAEGSDAKNIWYRISNLPTVGHVFTEYSTDPKNPYTNPTVNDNVEGRNYADPSHNHYRKGYSDHECMEYVENKVAHMLKFANHSPYQYDYGNCGAFLQWVLDCRVMDLGNGYYHHPIYVDPFGLGSFYTGICDPTENVYVKSDDYDEYSHPMMEWGYGTKCTNRDLVGLNIPVLPRNWPFNGLSKITTPADGDSTARGDYGELENVNNITLSLGPIYPRDEYGVIIDAGMSDEVSTEEGTVYYGRGALKRRTKVDGGNKYNLWYNRHMFTFYNDFSAISYADEPETPEGYNDHATAIKPAFIHLATPIDTNDGDEFEITVSLVNINTDKAFQGNTIKEHRANMASYYAFVSRPRVYVLSGTQNFASGRYYPIDDSFAYLDKDGNKLIDGTPAGFEFCTDGQLTHVSGDGVLPGTIIRFSLLTMRIAPTDTTFRGKIVKTTSWGDDDSSPDFRYNKPYTRIQVMYGITKRTEYVYMPEEERGKAEHPIYLSDGNDRAKKDSKGRPIELKAIQVDAYRNTATLPFDMNDSTVWAEVKKELSICNIAYVEQQTYPDIGTQTLGLTTHVDTLLGTEFVKGNELVYEEGKPLPSVKVESYSKMFSVDENTGATLMPGDDKRYIAATVYPTTTNTFQWALSNRKLLSHVEYTMTSAFDSGEHSMAAESWRLNKELLDNFPMMGCVRNSNGFITGHYNTTPDATPVSYSAAKDTASVDGMASWVGRNTRVSLGATVFECDCSEVGQPVRQAGRVYRTLMNDLYLTKCGYGASTNSSTRISISEAARTAWPALGESFYTADTLDSQDGLAGAGIKLWNARLRHVPPYVRDAFNQSRHCGETDNWEPYHDSKFDSYMKYSDYAVGGTLASLDSCDEVRYSLFGYPALPSEYSIRSVVSDVLSHRYIMKSNEKDFYDMLRYAESQESVISSDMHRIEQRYTYETEREFWMEPWTSFTKIFSIDNIPSPTPTKAAVDSLRYTDYPGYLDPEQQDISVAKNRASIDRYAHNSAIFVSGDPVATYARVSNYGELRSVAEIMSIIPSMDAYARKTSAIASWLEKYIPAHAAGLPMRFYKGTRVEIPQSGISGATAESRAVYDKMVDWMHERIFPGTFEDAGNTVNRYLNDNFAVGSALHDRNMDDLYLPYGNDRPYELNASAPPYTVDRSFYNRFGERPTYIRVYMKFTFSGTAGRWFCTDYRQTPTSYLTPLYGAKALDQKVPVVKDGKGNHAILKAEKDASGQYTGKVTSNLTDYLWENSACVIGNTYLSAVYERYGRTPPMDINIRAVPFLFNRFPYDYTKKWILRPENGSGSDNPEHDVMERLARPYLTWEKGGIGLYPPANVNGGPEAAKMDAVDENGEHSWRAKLAQSYVQTNNGIHANIWQVHEFIRPAVSALPGTDIPSFDWDNMDGYGDDRKDSPDGAEKFDYEHTGKAFEIGYTGRFGGIYSDPTLYRMFMTPKQNSILYRMPDERDPSIDLLDRAIVWHNDEKVVPPWPGYNTRTFPVEWDGELGASQPKQPRTDVDLSWVSEKDIN